MYKQLFYTPKKHIPAFMVMENNHGDRYIEILNPRTGHKEILRLDRLGEMLKAADFFGGR